MTKGLVQQFTQGAVEGVMLGAMTGAHGAVKMSSDIINCASILAAGVGLFSGALSAVRNEPDNSYIEKIPLERLAIGFACLELMGGIIGFVANKVMGEWIPSPPAQDFALAMLAGYPFSLAILYCMQEFQYYFQMKQAVEKNAEALRSLHMTP